MAENSTIAQTASQSSPRVKGSRVWLDMDQKALDDAYDQRVYAPNHELVAKRRRLASESLLKRRGELIVMERGWQDIALDARRYRLQIPPRLVFAMASLLPIPDLIFVLEAPTEVLLDRYLPDVPRRTGFPGRTAPFDLTRARTLLGFDPIHLYPVPVREEESP